MSNVALSQTPYRFAVYTHGLNDGQFCWYECLNLDNDPKPYLSYLRSKGLIKIGKTRLHVGFVDGSKVVIYRNYFGLDSPVNRTPLWTSGGQFTWVEQGYSGLLDLIPN